MGLVRNSLTDKRTASMDCEIELGVTEKELNLFPEQLHPTSNAQKKIPSLLDIKVYPTPSLVHAARRQNTKKARRPEARKKRHPPQWHQEEVVEQAEEGLAPEATYWLGQAQMPVQTLS